MDKIKEKVKGLYALTRIISSAPAIDSLYLGPAEAAATSTTTAPRRSSSLVPLPVRRNHRRSQSCNHQADPRRARLRKNCNQTVELKLSRPRRSFSQVAVWRRRVRRRNCSQVADLRKVRPRRSWSRVVAIEQFDTLMGLINFSLFLTARYTCMLRCFTHRSIIYANASFHHSPHRPNLRH